MLWKKYISVKIMYKSVHYKKSPSQGIGSPAYSVAKSIGTATNFLALLIVLATQGYQFFET